MLWFPLALGAALTLATADALTKRAVDGTGFLAATWLRGVVSLPFLFAAMFFVPVPELDATYYVAVVAALPLEIVASLMYIRAIQVSPLSLTIPFLSLTPVYAMAFSYVMLGERPSPAGGLGVGLICAGAYLLNVGSVRRGGLMAPFRAIAREPGSMMMMAVSGIYAVTSNLGKMAILHSSPVFYAGSYWAAYCALLTVVLTFHDRRTLAPAKLKGSLKVFIPIGVAHAAMMLMHMYAITMTQVSYMIAVKRTSMLFSIGFGYLMFRERNVRERALGATVMFAGLYVLLTN